MGYVCLLDIEYPVSYLPLIFECFWALIKRNFNTKKYDNTSEPYKKKKPPIDPHIMPLPNLKYPNIQIEMNIFLKITGILGL